MFLEILQQFFNGLSLASILLLTALGLALSFGLMRVINMAQGEMLMMGGYLTYISLNIFPTTLGYPLGMLIAFFGTAIFGMLLEFILIRHLYHRPLDTLLATWGVSLILQQAARDIFGPSGNPVIAPSWLTGTLFQLSIARLFIIAMAIFMFILVIFLITRTRIGLWVRAVHQDRDMAEALGINSRFVDCLVFSLGSGIAGLAGSVHALIQPVTPTVGQDHIVDAFLVVILGGLGSLTGTLLAAILIGLLLVFLQMVTSISTAKVILLLFVIGFIQLWPKGIRPTHSRALEEV